MDLLFPTVGSRSLARLALRGSATVVLISVALVLLALRVYGGGAVLLARAHEGGAEALASCIHNPGFCSNKEDVRAAVVAYESVFEQRRYLSPSPKGVTISTSVIESFAASDQFHDFIVAFTVDVDRPIDGIPNWYGFLSVRIDRKGPP